MRSLLLLSITAIAAGLVIATATLRTLLMLPRASMHLPSVRSAMRRIGVMELDPACLESSEDTPDQ